MEKQCEALFSQAKKTVCQQLAKISMLDQEVQRKTYRSSTLKLKLLEHLPKKDRNQTECYSLYKEINSLDDEISLLTDQKVEHSNLLYCQIANYNDQFNEKTASLLEKQAQRDEKDWDLRNLIAQCKIGESNSNCICPPEERSKKDELMIQCEGMACPNVWYHISCVGIEEKYIPKEWNCDTCKLKAKLME